MSEQDVQDWFDSGPITRDTLTLWLSILNDKESQ
jgi:hypothetical protein